MGIAVGIDLLWLGDRAAGVGRYAAELLPALLEEAPGTRIVAFAGRGLPSDLAAAPWAAEIEWVRLPVKLSGAPRLAAELLALPALAVARRLDVLHSPAAVGPAVAPTVATVITIHDLLWMHQGDRWESSRAQRSARVLQTHGARRADRVIADSRAARDDIVKGLQVDPSRIDVVLLGVRSSDAVEATAEAELRGRLDLDDARVVLCVAQKRPYKNLAALIRAVAALEELGPRLVLPGAPTPHEQELRELTDDLGVADRVRFCDWMSEPDLEGLYGLASCFVLPSLMEGFGLPVLEAMCRGVPVACSDRSSLPEVVGDAALLFDPAEQDQVTTCVRRLLTDGDLAAQLRRRGRVRCAELSWRRTAAGTLATYRRAIEQRRGVRRR